LLLSAGNALDVFSGALPQPVGNVQGLLRETDHLLGRFGEATRFSAEQAARLEFSPGRDAVPDLGCPGWGVLGRVARLARVFPSMGAIQVIRLERWLAGLRSVPFGAAAGPQVVRGPRARMLILSTWAQEDSDPEMTSSIQDPGIGFD
jgi:hypothetical protein